MERARSAAPRPGEHGRENGVENGVETSESRTPARRSARGGSRSSRSDRPHSTVRSDSADRVDHANRSGPLERLDADAEDELASAWTAIAALIEDARERERLRACLAQRNLAEISRFSASRLAHVVSETSARRLAAAFALGRAVEVSRAGSRPLLASAAAVAPLVAPRLRGLAQEHFLSLLLDGRHRLQRVEPVSAGTLTSSLVHPREVFGAAVRESAAAVIVVHNHPSGDPTPSAEDREVTRRLIECGRLLGVPLLDHLIVGDPGWVSLREQGGDLGFARADDRALRIATGEPPAR